MVRLYLWAASLCWLLGPAVLQAKPPQVVGPAIPWVLKTEHAPLQPHSGEAVHISVQVQPGLTNVVLQYQLVEPGAYIELRDPAFTNRWQSLPMQPVESTNDQPVFQATLPAQLQKNRCLIRYKFSAMDANRQLRLAPDPAEMPPNYAYFVYDGVPAWSAAINPKSGEPKLSSRMTFPPETMNRVQAYHLIGKKTSIENATWYQQTPGKEYKYTGTLVVDGEVFDHVAYRARGGVWRYAMGKNMWKFALPGNHLLHARDDFGRYYAAPWSKVNLRACIQQGDYGQRGEQGMFESVGFRLFNLAGVTAPHTHWIQLRIIDEAQEAPADQYRGDFWGLYLAIENEDGHFLKSHGLPGGNLYKMEFGGGTLEHHGTGAVTNGSDLHEFELTYSRGNPPDAWWRTNFDLPDYFSYRAICECIHHYDIADGKNYDYFHNPQTGQWEVIPWDIDLTWTDNMYGSGNEPFKHRVLSHPAFRLEYQNRLCEIRDLLFNPEQTGQLIDEYAAVIWDRTGRPSIAEADRRKWDYHPVMAQGGKAGQGLFYEAARSGDFPGMVRLMKNFVKSRGAWIDSVFLADKTIPETPSVSSACPANFPTNQLRFRASAYKGANEFAAVKWRLAEITPGQASIDTHRARRLYEIMPVWESAELMNASLEISVPTGLAKCGHTYRVRVRMKDVTGRWSHWSPALEFSPSPTA